MAYGYPMTNPYGSYDPHPYNPFLTHNPYQLAPQAPAAQPTAQPLTVPVDEQVRLLRADMSEKIAYLEALAEADKDPDTQVLVAGLAAELAKALNAVKNVPRNTLWQRYGAGTHATPAGRKFSFTNPGPTRSTDYKILETEFPAAFHAAVSTKAPASVGRLTVK